MSSFDFSEVLRRMVEVKASDVHLTAGFPPAMRDKGKITPMEDFPVLGPQETRETIFSILNDDQRKRFENNKQLDFAYAIPGVARFRVNCFMQRGSVSAAFRLVPQEIPALDSLGVPQVLHDLTEKPRGFVLVTGPTGSGKSTTLAAMLDLINSSRQDHILTIEDPIEFLHKHKRSIVNQREVGADADDFALGLRAALREDPDVILVGEMRDLETISTALTAAETGHLVFATLHTQSPRPSTGSSTSSRPSSRARSGPSSRSPCRASSPSNCCRPPTAWAARSPPRCWCRRRRSAT
jgi:twitching motility protein PilT